MAEKKIIELEVKNNLGSLKSQLREAQAEVAKLSEQFGVTSKEAAEAARRAAELKDQIGDAKALTDAFNPDAKFKALSSSLGGVASGFAAYQGALGLIGVESKEVEAQLLKVQSAMAVADGLQSVGESIDSFKQLGSVIKNQVVAAFSTLRGAIMATGIGLIVTAVAFLLPKIIEWADWTGRARKKQEELNESLEKQQLKIRESRKELEKDLEFRLRYARALGKSEEELAKIKESNTKKTNASIYSEIKEKRKQLDELRKVDLGIMASSREQYNELVKNNKKQREAKVEEIKKLKGEIEDNNKELLIEQTEQNTKEKELYVKGAKDKTDVVIDSANDTAAKELEIEEKRIQNLLRLRDEYLNEIEQAESDYYDSKLSKDELEIQTVNDKYFRLIELAKEYGESTVVLEQAQADEIARIQKDVAEKKAKTDEEIKAQDEKNKQEQLDKERELRDKKIQMGQQAFGALADLSTLFANGNEADQRKAFQLNKAANLGLAIMNTAQAVTGALTAGGNPLKLATGMQFVEAGIAATTGGINIARIAATQFQGTGGGDTATATPTAPRTPSFDIIQAQPQMQLGALQQQPVKAYVVSGEVSTAQALDRNRVRNATF
jgi:hypothetical protein